MKKAQPNDASGHLPHLPWDMASDLSLVQWSHLPNEVASLGLGQRSSDLAQNPGSKPTHSTKRELIIWVEFLELECSSLISLIKFIACW